MAVVRDVSAEQSSEVPLVEHDDVVQALAAHRPDHAFHVWILPRRPRRGAHGRQAKRRHGAAERGVEGSFVVMQQEPRRDFPGNASRSRCRIHLEVGCRVTLMCRMRRRSCARTTRTKRSRQVIVGTTKKSTATIEPTWFCRNARQVCDGGRRRLGISREMSVRRRRTRASTVPRGSVVRPTMDWRRPSHE